MARTASCSPILPRPIPPRAMRRWPNGRSGARSKSIQTRTTGCCGTPRFNAIAAATLRIARHSPRWRGRAAVDENDVAAALDLYRQALARVNPAPADLLTQVSGDLGNRGRLAEIIELCAPRFDVQLHGLTVGNNLIKAYVDLGEAGKARAIVEQLYD